MPAFSPELLLIFYVANQLLSALVQALPEPDTSSSKIYVFFFRFFSLLVADFKSFSNKLPVPSFTTTTGSITATTVPVGVQKSSTVVKDTDAL